MLVKETFVVISDTEIHTNKSLEMHRVKTKQQQQKKLKTAYFSPLRYAQSTKVTKQ